MGRRWSQRNAWITWVLASLFGWLAIIATIFLPSHNDTESVAQDPSVHEKSDFQPASGPTDSDPKQK